MGERMLFSFLGAALLLAFLMPVSSESTQYLKQAAPVKAEHATPAAVDVSTSEAACVPFRISTA